MLKRVCQMMWVLALAACSSITAPGSGGGAANATSAQVTGTVTYLQRMALPPTAVLTVRLVDVSRSDAAALIIAEQVIRTEGRQVPFSFAIGYNGSRIDQRLSYAVQARIEDAGQLLFISDQRYPVITQGGVRHVDMVLRAAGGQGGR